MDIVSILENSAKRFPWKKCIVSEQGGLNYRGLNKKADILAGALKENLGINKGDTVGILLNNCPEYIVTIFAVLKAGAICVPLNTFLSFTELKYILQDCRAKLLISSSQFLPVLQNIRQEKQGALSALQEILLQDKKEKDFLSWDTVVCGQQHKNSSPEITPEDTAFLIYTSGTTGFPKGVMLSHDNLCANITASVKALKVTGWDRLLLVLPMFHSFTLTVCILIPIFIGAKIILIKSLKPFDKVLRSILFNRVTIIVGIPQLFDTLKNLHLPAWLYKFLRVKICISGAAPLSVETLQLFKNKFRTISLLEGYGLTEASPVVSITPLKGTQKAGSIGLPLPGIEVKVVTDDERELPTGEIGELIIKGPNVMRGYLNQPEETQKTIRGGWLFTGDLAKIDTEGYMYIVGRKKDMIISHGMNIYPMEIENVLKNHPKIKEAAVVGKKDRSKGEVPVAFVVPEKDQHITDHEIINFCRNRLANYKVPRLIEFRQDLPKTATGKILKRSLVETLTAL